MNDVEEVHRYFGNAEVMRYIPAGISKTCDDTRARIARVIKIEREWGYCLWAVVEKSSGRIIGDCGIFPAEGKGPEIEVAYRFARKSWGKGYASEAATTVLNYGFEKFNLDRIVAIAEVDNLASRRVMQKIGMTYFGEKDYYDRKMVVYEAYNTYQKRSENE